MPKLQVKIRNNGSVLNSVNLPLECMEELGWVKGADLIVEIVSLKGKKGLVISEVGL